MSKTDSLTASERLVTIHVIITDNEIGQINLNLSSHLKIYSLKTRRQAISHNWLVSEQPLNSTKEMRLFNVITTLYISKHKNINQALVSPIAATVNHKECLLAH